MGLIDLTITPAEKNLGGFSVRRVLPAAKQRMVGPFIFLDHIGPANFAPGKGIDVRPHPHIGLATVTYLFEGHLMHLDSLGSSQLITPGATNWMTAGRGIVHSERSGQDARTHPHALHGMQSWVALPKEYEETTPEFHHHPAATLPDFSISGVNLKLIAGAAYGHTAPVKIYSPLFYLEARMQPGSRLTLPNEYSERAIYLVDGALRIGAQHIAAKTMPIFAAADTIVVESENHSHLILLGGDPLPEPRFIWWNFVSSSQARIEQAKQDWKAGRFATVPGDEKEFIALPERP